MSVNGLHVATLVWIGECSKSCVFGGVEKRGRGEPHQAANGMHLMQASSQLALHEATQDGGGSTAGAPEPTDWFGSRREKGGAYYKTMTSIVVRWDLDPPETSAGEQVA